MPATQMGDVTDFTGFATQQRDEYRRKNLASIRGEIFMDLSDAFE